MNFEKKCIVTNRVTIDTAWPLYAFDDIYEECVLLNLDKVDNNHVYEKNNV